MVQEIINMTALFLNVDKFFEVVLIKKEHYTVPRNNFN